eukprot:SAG31_NODE_11044_length_1072_cov_0.603289_1_plen_54_part_10
MDSRCENFLRLGNVVFVDQIQCEAIFGKVRWEQTEKSLVPRGTESDRLAGSQIG